MLSCARVCETYFDGDILYTHASEVENNLPVVLSYVNVALFLLQLHMNLYFVLCNVLFFFFLCCNP